jgi:Pectinesterase
MRLYYCAPPGRSDPPPLVARSSLLSPVGGAPLWRGAIAVAMAALLALLAAPGTAWAGAVRRHHVLVVAQDGRPGTFASVQAAIDAVPPGSEPVTIRIEPGTYWGQVYVPASRPDLTLAGASGNPADVTLVDDIAHGTIAPNGNQYGTDCSATLSVAGNGFSAYGLTVQNSFDPAANPQVTSPQAARPLPPRRAAPHRRPPGSSMTTTTSPGTSTSCAGRARPCSTGTRSPSSATRAAR